MFSYRRESLIERTLKDVPSLGREKAEAEVDKFLLDSEALGMMIQFYKMKAEDPDFEVPDTKEDEGFFSLRTLVYFYLAYVAYTSGPVLLRRFVASQEEAGNWQGTGIPALDDWLASTPAVTEAVQTASDTVQAVADSLN